MRHARSVAKKRCAEKYGVIAEDGGALAPPMKQHGGEAFETMLSVARQVGCEKHVFLGLDVAPTNYLTLKNHCYNMKKRLHGG